MRIAVRAPARADLPLALEFAPRVLGLLWPETAEGRTNRKVVMETRFPATAGASRAPPEPDFGPKHGGGRDALSRDAGRIGNMAVDCSTRTPPWVARG